MADSNEQRWFICLGCRCKLAPVTIRNGRTVIPVLIFGREVWVDRAEFSCPFCGKRRKFFSAAIVKGGKSRGTFPYPSTT